MKTASIYSLLALEDNEDSLNLYSQSLRGQGQSQSIQSEP